MTELIAAGGGCVDWRGHAIEATHQASGAPDANLLPSMVTLSGEGRMPPVGDLGRHLAEHRLSRPDGVLA